MADVIDEVKVFFEQWTKQPAGELYTLKQAGSNRQYFRGIAGARSYIITSNPNNIAENNAFIEFARHFYGKQLAVPEILYTDKEKTMYVQTDFGDTSLFDIIKEEGYSTRVKELYRKAFAQLARLQVQGGEGLDYNNCIATKSFDKQAIYSDLLYFLYYFVRALDLPYDKNLLLNDFELLSSYLMQEEAKYFMHRDCQSRNVMIKDERVYFIDFQGGMQGALQYDAAAMLWQARAALPHEWKEELVSYYFEKVNELLGNRLDKKDFLDSYDGFVLIRMLQTLGAYGFRGLFERKQHFITSIPFALKQLRWFLENKKIPIRLPELQKVLWHIVDDSIMERYETVKAAPGTALVVHINSFSYRNGIPGTDTENGGGFVFDCRGIFNPGRFEAYKKLTGRDKEVQEFLLHKSEMPAFLQYVYGIVDISVSGYIKRNFESLVVNFGCTGGQHRSVFAADSLAKHLQEKFGVKVALHHLVQEEKNWVNG
ncbi:RapZ C-terminal domain-containing protein [Agriterribacter sp.]|uniref:RapZ C-terminal domain-containing protein n=1 Tax=Agriterribacter sp. TaxID=2821509 RepID=UPI002CF69E48|nr:RNase adapter RapZ [Agriterribacter sp.]HTN05431.1 RNase adapter RapZ [Agriterribacter sp.]